jgi:NADH:ubiquinone oxidoreductase subunit 6 (subunit J)
MKSRILKVLAGATALGSFLGGLSLTGWAAVFPPDVAAVLVIVPPLGAAIVHFATAMGDRIDDGQANGSFLRCHPLAFLFSLLLALNCAMFMTSCTTVTNPDGTSVTKSDPEAAKPWTDLARDLIGIFRPLNTPPRPIEVEVVPTK